MGVLVTGLVAPPAPAVALEDVEQGDGAVTGSEIGAGEPTPQERDVLVLLPARPRVDRAVRDRRVEVEDGDPVIRERCRDRFERAADGGRVREIVERVVETE